MKKEYRIVLLCLLLSILIFLIQYVNPYILISALDNPEYTHSQDNVGYCSVEEDNYIKDKADISSSLLYSGGESVDLVIGIEEIPNDDTIAIKINNKTQGYHYKSKEISYNVSVNDTIKVVQKTNTYSEEISSITVNDI